MTLGGTTGPRSALIGALATASAFLCVTALVTTSDTLFALSTACLAGGWALLLTSSD